MSNSPLVDYVNLSPNHSGKRNHAIDTITIHCVAGNASVEALGSVFASAARGASSNYGIGTDGRIALYVDEENRSWCTSSASNDHRAITIEVANDGGAPDWHVSNAAMVSLILLVADICKRNGIKKLLWKGDKSLVGQVNEQNMTVHRWFAAKACPGDYLYSKHGYIAEEVNKILESEEEYENVDIDKLIREMTPEQAYTLLAKAQSHQDGLLEPAWSQKEGHWKRATEAGVVDGTGPERPMKRDEVIAVLGRKGLV